MQERQEQPRGMLQEASDNINLALGLLFLCSMPAAALWRKPGTAGNRFFSGLWAFLAFLLLLAWGGLAMSPWLTGAAWAYLLLLAMHKVRHRRLRKQGWISHSQYVGDSRLAFLGGNEAARGKWEPFLTMLAGFGALAFDPAFGCWLLLAAFGLGASFSMIQWREEAEDRAAIDAWHVQQRAARRFRDRMGDFE